MYVLLAPICLPEKSEDFLGKFGWAAGWGALNPGSRLRPKTLQAVDVPVIENRFLLLPLFLKHFFTPQKLAIKNLFDLCTEDKDLPVYLNNDL